MIKIDASNRDEVLEFLEKESIPNLFLIGDILEFGFDTPNIIFYQLKVDNILMGVVLKFKDNSLHFYLPTYNEDIANQVKAYLYKNIDTTRMLFGSKTYNLYKDIFNEFTKDEKKTMMSAFDLNLDLVSYDDVEILSEKDAQDIYEIYRTCFTEKSMDAIMESFKGSDIHYGIRKDGHIVSIGSTACETNLNAMVIGVATLPEYRGQSLATKVVSTLTNALKIRGKSGILFYDNPSAARIYEGLGYVPYDDYYMNTYKKPE